MLNLVTGGAGFVGQHLVARLVARGEAVRVFDLTCPEGTFPSNVEVIQGSITDAAAVAAAMDGVDCVFHVAANAHLWARDKSVFDRINHHGTRIVLGEARQAGVPRLIHTSSLTVLVGKRMRGTPRTVNEETAPRAKQMLGPYCLSKWRAEHAALAANTEDFAVTAVLPTLPVGPGDKRLTAPTRMILDLVNGKIPAFLDCIHNVIDVRDVAEGHILARDRGLAGARYLLGAENLTMAEFVAALGRITGAPMPKARVPYAVALAAGHVSEWISDHVTRKPPQAPLTGVRLAGRPVRFDCSKAVHELGLAPRPAEEAIRDAVRWLKEEGLVKKPLPALETASVHG